VVSFDEQGLLSYWNPAAERLFGRPTRSVAGRPVHMLLPCPPLVATAGVGIAGLCNAGDPLFSGAVVEVTSVDAAGRPLPLEVSFTAYRNGHAWNATAFVRDARAHKRQEEELRQARDRAEEATRAKSLFLATMSHELRTPLSGVIGMMQLGLRESMSPQARSRIELGLANAEALLTIINDILDFSKIEAGKMTFEAVDFDPRELVQSLVELLDYRAQEKGLSLLMHVDPSVPRWLRSDPVRVRQVLLNLIGNALKFTETGGVDVDLACHSDGAGQLWLQVGVRDTGIGISPEAQTRLFQGFEQADVTTTRKYGGTGLGLTITRSLIDGMRGHLALDSEPGSGSCFRFELPVRVGAPVLARDEEVLGAFDCRLQILCAEDGHTNRVIVQAFVQGMGHDVEFVENGLECVHRCAEARFDLILMDGRMPVMDGLEAARAIRAGGLEDTFVLDPGLWMIALTANATAKDRDECMAAGMDDFLAKPVDERQLGFALHRAVTTLRARGHALRPLAPAPEAGLAGLDALFFGADVVPAPPPPAAPGATSPAAPAAMPQPPDATPVAQPPAAALTPLAERLREVFRTETPRLLAELAQALGVHDLGTAARIAHNIKGSAFYVECEPIAETAGALEHACDERSFERIDPAWVELQACYTRWTTEN